MATKQEKSREEKKAQIEKLRDRWSRADGAAKKANLEAGAVKKEDQDKVLVAALKLGWSKATWKDSMTRMDHLDKAVTHREKVVATEDLDRLTEYDRLLMITEDVLPLFDNALVDEIDKSAARVMEEEQETEETEDNVVSIGKGKDQVSASA